jgi:hypothetical protein
MYCLFQSFLGKVGLGSRGGELFNQASPCESRSVIETGGEPMPPNSDVIIAWWFLPHVRDHPGLGPNTESI